MNKILVPIDKVARKIYLLRGQKIMLDRDLAKLYGVKPFRLREQVKRNRSRFPKDFMFQLNEQEVDLMVSQNAIPSKGVLGGHLPYGFTEHGALMLASVLNSDRAVKMSIFIVRVFVKMRELLSTHKQLSSKIDEMEKKYDSQFKFVFDALRKLIDPKDKPKPKIGFLRSEG